MRVPKRGTGAEQPVVNLKRANLAGADLQGADLQRANLWEANLVRALLWEADFRGVKGLTQEHLDSATFYYGAKLPDYLKKGAGEKAATDKPGKVSQPE